MTVARFAACPVCQSPSRRVHSRYWRTLADLPCGEVGVTLKISARRFVCGNPLCPRRLFCERLPQLTVAYAQRTNRLRQAQTKIAQAVGSRPGARLVGYLRMATSATTLLRLERAVPLPDFATPRVLGVDDWAFRRGHRYGTILYDLEQHQVVDLLPERTPETLADWLLEHPGVEIVSRDRAEAYACGVRQGAPNATQVADRWHLVKNLGQALERLLEDKRTLLKQAVMPPPSSETEKEESESVPPAASLNRQEARLAQEKYCRLERYEEVRELFSQGWNISAISQHLNLSRKTVRAFAHASTFPERKERAPRPCRIDAYKAYLQQRWQEGCHNAVALYKEIQERGYPGGYTVVRDYLNTRRAVPTGTQTQPRAKVSQHQVAMWTLRRENERTSRQQAILDRLSDLCEPFRAAFGLAQRFLAMVRQCPRTEQTEVFRQWLQEVLSSESAPLRGFALSLKQDQAAVEAGLSLPWSNGAVKGSNNRLKFLKRRGFGRANFDLLRRRVLQPT